MRKKCVVRILVLVLIGILLLPVVPVICQNAAALSGKRFDWIKITKNDLENILSNHKKWLVTNKKEGKKANLRGAELIGVQLYETDLSEADLRGANLTKAKLIGTKLYRADLRNVILISAKLKGADLREADLREPICKEPISKEPKKSRALNWKKPIYWVPKLIKVLQKIQMAPGLEVGSIKKVCQKI